MDGFFQTILGMKKIANEKQIRKEQTNYIFQPESQRRRKRSDNNPYKKETTHERRNIFAHNELYYQKCRELELKIKRLERANKYLIDQIIHTMTFFNQQQHRTKQAKKENTVFKLETGVQSQGSSSISGSRSDENKPKKKLGSPFKKCKSNLTESFAVFKDLLESKKQTQGLFEMVFGDDFDLKETISEKTNCLKLVSKLLRVSITTTLLGQTETKPGSKEIKVKIFF